MKKYFSFLFVLSFLALFLSFSSARSDTGNVIINEIGAYEASGNEWLEIYNRGDGPVDLTGWKFWENGTNHALALKQGNDFILDPGEFALITQDDKKFLAEYPNVTSTLLDSSWTTLSEDGEDIGLKFGTGENDFGERFQYIASDNFSLERKDPNLDDYTENNWVEHVSGNTIGAKNSVFVVPVGDPPVEEIPIIVNPLVTSTVDIPEVVTSSTSSTLEIPIFVSLSPATSTQEEVVPVVENSVEASASIILINEIMIDPHEGEKEWIELYNAGTGDVILDGFTLDDGVGLIASPTGTIAAHGFFVVELKSNKLNNDGDALLLKNASGDVVDALSFGTWDDGNILDNALASQKGNTLMRKNPETTDNNREDFFETSHPTKGSENIFVEVPVEEVMRETSPSNESLNQSKDGGGTSNVEVPPSFPPGSLVINELLSDPGVEDEEFVEIFNTTNASINLEGVKLRDGGGSLTELTGTLAGHGFFVVEKPKGNLNNTGDQLTLLDPSGAILDTVTYGSWDDGNMLDNAPLAQEAMSLARKVDGFDSDNDNLDFVATLEITAGWGNSIRFPVPQKEESEIALASVKLVLNEVLPNPVGDDTKDEFIEIYNPTTSSVSLVGWKISDTNNHYTIHEKVLGPKDYAVFLRSVTGISLNNTGGDQLQLFDPRGNLIDTLMYSETAEEGYSFGLGDTSVLEWSRTASPGEKNKTTSIEALDDTASNRQELLAVKVEKTSTKLSSAKKVSTPKKKTVKKVAGIKIKAGQKVSLSQIREQDKGTWVTTTGTLAVLPGILGTQYFYIVDDTSGVQIFMSKKDFPSFEVGDSLRITGQVSESYGETRINVQNKSQIERVEQGQAPLAQSVELASIAESFEGALVENTGQVTDVKSSYMYIDDGTAEIKVYFKRGTGITRDDVKLGSTVKLRGIVSALQGGYQILPRSKDDLLLIASSTENIAPIVSKDSKSLKKIMTVVFAVIASILLGLLLKTQIPPKSPLTISKSGNRR